MKLIKKSDLSYIDGYLVDHTNEVVPLAALANEYNELMDVLELNTFLKANKKAILSPAEVVVFKPTAREKPVFKYDKEVSTPLLDAEVEDAKAKAEEFFNKQTVSDVKHHLERYVRTARWLAEEYILVASGGVMVRFKGNVLELTEAEVVSIIEDYNDPEISKLRKLVRIDFS